MAADRLKIDMASTYFSVTIDTEEEGLWSGAYAATGAVSNIGGVPRFQSVCDEFGVRPTYLVDAPVVLDDQASMILKVIQDDGRAEIGAHVHPWNTPPLEEESTRFHSYLCNLPASLQRAKLEWLTESIERRFDKRPISFRAGRYGIDSVTLQILCELGYRVDSSILPYADYTSQGGPDFSRAPMTPHLVLPESSTSDPLLEIPIASGFTHRHFEIAQQLRSGAMKTPLRQLRTVGILDRLGIAAQTKLSPEQASAKRMRDLARSLVARGSKCLVLMFHSSSLKPGCSPYVRSDSDLDKFLERLRLFFAFAIEELKAAPIPLGECYDLRHSLVADAVGR